VKVHILLGFNSVELIDILRIFITGSDFNTLCFQTVFKLIEA
jgi:hypothetical protein